MSTLLQKVVPASSKRKLKRRWNELRFKYRRLLCSFTAEDLLAGLRRCDLHIGDSVLVHSSYGGFQGFRGTAVDVIGTLQKAVSSEGTLMMPTHSFEGVAAEYSVRPKVFNPLTSPSYVGLLPDLFRRTEGVRRSLHPTHSVAAWGKRSSWFLHDHHRAASPCGRGTPYHRLLEADGKILLIDTPPILTFYHCVEELLEPLFPFSPFTRDTYSLPIKTDAGVIYSAPMRLFDPAVSARRSLEPLEEALREAGLWKETKVANVRLAAVRARDVVATTEMLARQGVFCYRDLNETVEGPYRRQKPSGELSE